jgi:hypothetical protein
VAHVAGNRGAQKQAAADQNAAQQQQLEAQQQQLEAQQQQAAAPAAPAEDPTTAELQKLATMHTQGILTDEEFAASKAKLLGI